MNVFEPQSPALGEGATPEFVDDLLRSFFRSEMPKSWPNPPLPAATVKRLPLWRRCPGRLALAASVLLALAAQAFLFRIVAQSSIDVGPTPGGPTEARIRHTGSPGSAGHDLPKPLESKEK
jgi:hypothetical protein